MEHTILASVTSILIGFVVMENDSNERVVRRYLRDGTFKGMVTTLKQYYDFLNLTVSVSFSANKTLSIYSDCIFFPPVRSFIISAVKNNKKRD